MITVTILGEKWKIIERNECTAPQLKDYDGFCDSTTRTIIIDDMKDAAKSPNAKADLERYKRQVLRHELIHALLSESGLESESPWANNEEMVDFFALQYPKIKKIFAEAGIED